jgi:magnesium transporter
MIRSLTAQLDDATDEIIVKRNIDQAELCAAVKHEHKHLWIDIVDPKTEEISWLADCLSLNPAVVQDLRRQDHRPALLVYPSYLFVSLFQPHLRTQETESSEIHCVITDTCFVTIRHSEASAVDDAYNRVAQNPDTWRSGVAYFLYLTSQNVIDNYYLLLDRINNQLNILEGKLLNEGFEGKIQRRQVYRIKQRLIKLHQMVAPLNEVFSNLIGEERLFGSEASTRDLFRHLYERLLRVYDVISNQRDLSSDVLDMMQNHESRQLSKTVNRLTILSMIFLPLTFFTSLFELGFVTTTEPFELPISGQMIFIAVMMLMILSVTLMILIFKWRKWI